MIKTVSLETAKALKEAGFRQETGFHWVFHRLTQTWGILQFCGDIEKNIASPTTDELLEELPKGTWELQSTFGGYRLNYMDTKILYFDLKERKNKNLADLFAAMWLYLKKEGLLPESKTGGRK